MLIGLTGGIGSGKSTIAQQLRAMGYPVYDTDSQAKRLIQSDPHVREQITALFGTEVYQDGVYQTALVAQRVFADPVLLSRLNAIVHPAVRADILRWSSSLTSLPNNLIASSPHRLSGELEGEPIAFIECAILYSSHIHTLCDAVVQVTAPEDVRIQRTIQRDHTTIDKVRARMRAQDKEFLGHHPDLVVNNDGKTEIHDICLEIQDFFCNFAG